MMCDNITGHRVQPTFVAKGSITFVFALGMLTYKPYFLLIHCLATCTVLFYQHGMLKTGLL